MTTEIDKTIKELDSILTIMNIEGIKMEGYSYVPEFWEYDGIYSRVHEIESNIFGSETIIVK